VADAYRDAANPKAYIRLRPHTEFKRFLRANTGIHNGAEECADPIQQLPSDDAAPA
jgi:hypothetical protein